MGVVAGAVAIAALGFLGGVQVQKSRGERHATGGAPAASPARRPGAAGAAAGAPAAAAQAQTDATVGEVSSVDGKTIYVDDASGNTVRVRLGKGGEGHAHGRRRRRARSTPATR